MTRSTVKCRFQGGYSPRDFLDFPEHDPGNNGVFGTSELHGIFLRKALPGSDCFAYLNRENIKK